LDSRLSGTLPSGYLLLARDRRAARFGGCALAGVLPCSASSSRNVWTRPNAWWRCSLTAASWTSRSRSCCRIWSWRSAAAENRSSSVGAAGGLACALRDLAELLAGRRDVGLELRATHLPCNIGRGAGIDRRAGRQDLRRCRHVIEELCLEVVEPIGEPVGDLLVGERLH
jgi:hypothetical protein